MIYRHSHTKKMLAYEIIKKKNDEYIWSLGNIASIEII